MRVKQWDDFYAAPRSLPDMLRWAVTHSQLVTEVATYDRVLEVGTGTGMLSAIISKFCNLTVTLDNSPKVVRTALVLLAQADARVAPVQGDAFHLPFPDQSFGACFSQGLLEHFSDSQIDALVSEQLRVAATTYISVPSAFYPHIGRLGPGLVGNERLLTLGHWRRLLGDRTVVGEYYSDFKIASLGGRTVPWPAQILLRVSASGSIPARVATN